MNRTKTKHKPIKSIARIKFLRTSKIKPKNCKTEVEFSQNMKETKNYNFGILIQTQNRFRWVLEGMRKEVMGVENLMRYLYLKNRFS